LNSLHCYLRCPTRKSEMRCNSYTHCRLRLFSTSRSKFASLHGNHRHPSLYATCATGFICTHISTEEYPEVHLGSPSPSECTMVCRDEREHDHCEYFHCGPAFVNRPSMQQAMRNSNISDLPPLESAECEVLVKDVAREYSVQRSTLKKKVSSKFLLYIHELTLLSRSPTPSARRLTSQLSLPTSSHTACELRKASPQAS
jgi:hypothetical protein